MLDRTLSSTTYLSSEAEEPLWFNHLFQNVTLDASCAVVLVHHSVLQLDVVHRQTHVVLPAVDDGYGVEFVHHLWGGRNTGEAARAKGLVILFDVHEHLQRNFVFARFPDSVYCKLCVFVCVWSPSTLHSKPSPFSSGVGFSFVVWLSSWALSLLLYTHFIVSCCKGVLCTNDLSLSKYFLPFFTLNFH